MNTYYQLVYKENNKFKIKEDKIQFLSEAKQKMKQFAKESEGNQNISEIKIYTINENV